MTVAPVAGVDRRPERAAADPAAALLEIGGLGVSYGRGRLGRSRSAVLDGVDLSVRSGEIVGLIGETGSGKTTLARAAVGLVRPDTGTVRFEGRDLVGLGRRERAAFRRSGQVQYMFQDPLRSQDPDLTVRQIVAEPLAATGAYDRRERAARADEALSLVGLDPAAVATRTPGLISGGQRQRVSLARAVVTRPRLLLSDEPVSALDASNRNLVLGLLDRLRQELDLGVLVISHDLSSLAGIADRVAVLYRGHIVEEGPTREVLESPRHPYTALLTASAPSVRREHRLLPAQLRPPEGGAPWPAGEGCVFARRCRFADGNCRTQPVRRAARGPSTSGDAEPAQDLGVHDERSRSEPAAEVPQSANGLDLESPSPGGAGHTVACHHADDWRTRLD
ncbi:putative D,D-dipeptide transport ATP-binding protein DdpF [Streptomyces sp. YIM 130001]|uniref:ABC transporter ATP-binding protein n=1 Tax=Streptomyces sp. YIM 130001 TaxID=2259644 RepID=UPI000E65C738|nr:ABC transporter ATP-binding protein [Streptomyces sp. YIM 130001]RII14678.1 putative D,D-dipeptide transport ATP-binding protein DdpF [Streptomyces sp. YIM 130001]